MDKRPSFKSYRKTSKGPCLLQLEFFVHFMGSDDFSPQSRKIIGALSNFSIQFNIVVATVALAIMQTKGDAKPGPDEVPDYPIPDWAQFTALGAVFVGSILGMIIFGYLGDRIGSQQALRICFVLTIVGSILCGFLSVGSPDQIYGIICLGRLITGLGVGGIYPCSALFASENENKSFVDVGWSFFWQSPGALSPLIMGLILIELSPGRTDFQFRTLFGLGGLPPLCALVLLSRHKQHSPLRTVDIEASLPGDTQPNEDLPMVPSDSRSLPVPVDSSLREIVWENKWKLLLTGGSWLIYDIVFYGTSVFTPQILQALFTDMKDLRTLILGFLFISAAGVPGTLLTLQVLPVLGLKKLLTTGFLTQSLFFGLLCASMLAEKETTFLIQSISGLEFLENTYVAYNGALRFILFTFLMISLTYGVGIATYVLPTVVYPPEIRATMHGISATCGKVGALLASFLFFPLQNQVGIRGVLVVEAGLALVGCLLSQFALKDALVPP